MSGPTTRKPRLSIRKLLAIVLGSDPPSAGQGEFVIKLLDNPEPYVVPGLPAAPVDYYPTDNPTSLVQTASAAWADLLSEDERDELDGGASGGFDDPLSLTVAFGTGVRFVESDAVDDLIADAGEQIEVELLNPLIEICRDKYVFRVVRQFLVGDGGRFLAIPGGGSATELGPGWNGRYSSSRMSIEVDTSREAREIEQTLIHELLHYVFDKADSPLSGSVVDTSGGTWFLDHPVIGLLAGRIAYIRWILGQEPEEMSDLFRFRMAYGDGTGSQRHVVGETGLSVGVGDGERVYFQLETEPPFNERVRSVAFNAYKAAGTAAFGDRLADLRTAADSPAYLNALVSGGLLPLLLYREALGREIYPDEIYTDAAFLVAQFGACARRDWQEVALASAESNEPSYATGARLKAFTRSFILALQDDPFRGVAATERALRDW